MRLRDSGSANHPTTRFFVDHQPADSRRKIAVANHPGIFRKGERYLVQWRHKGRQRARSFRTLSEATRFKGQTVAGDTQPTSREPFKHYAQRWLTTYRGRTGRGLSDTTRETYADALTRLAVPYFGTARMDEIDAPMVRDYIAHLASKGLSPATVRRYLAPLRALLATAYEDGAIRTNPAAGVRVVVTDHRSSRRRRLTPEQTRALLSEMPASQADLAYFLAATGVRISEVLAARWGDLEQDRAGRPVLTIPKSKTPSGERILPLSPEPVRRLLRRRAESPWAADTDPIFPTDIGTPLEAHNYQRRVFRPAAERAGVPWATPHALRHGLASLMAEARLLCEPDCRPPRTCRRRGAGTTHLHPRRSNRRRRLHRRRPDRRFVKQRPGPASPWAARLNGPGRGKFLLIPGRRERSRDTT